MIPYGTDTPADWNPETGEEQYGEGVTADVTIKDAGHDANGYTGYTGYTPPGVTGESRRTRWKLADLMAHEFPAPRWAVPGLVAEGLTILCGPPKIGKSWLSLNIAVDVASGAAVLGKNGIQVQAGPVLYLALEDTPRRLQRRLRQVLGNGAANAPLEIWDYVPDITSGGGDEIRAWLDDNPDARLVIIDVFAKFRGSSGANTSAYDADYLAISRIKRIADEYQVSVILVHHVRKAGSDDFLSEVSGTHGIAGAADGVMVLKRSRGQADGELHVTSRDIEETKHALEFNADTGRWALAEDSKLLNDTRAMLLDEVRSNPGQGPSAIARATQIPLSTVKVTLGRMVEDGQLLRTPGGKYSPVSPVTGVTGVTVQGLTSENDRLHHYPPGVTGVTDPTYGGFFDLGA